MQGRTTFMIAHRLGTLANCDMRLEIEDGRVVSFEQRTLKAGVGTKVASVLDGSISTKAAVPRGSERTEPGMEILDDGHPEETQHRGAE